MAGHLEVFYIAEDGSIWDYFWYGMWKNFQLRPPGTVVMGGITAVSRRMESMSVFLVTSNGSIDAIIEKKVDAGITGKSILLEVPLLILSSSV